MITRGIASASAELLARILAEAGAADAIMDRFFRAHPALGARARGAIAETAYGCLRRYRLLAQIAANDDPRAVIAAYLARAGYSSRALATLALPHDDALIRRARAPLSSWPPAVAASLPDWLYDRLSARLAPAELAALVAALGEPAPLDVRVNTLKIDREGLRAALAADGHTLTATPWSPVGLRRSLRAPLFRTAAFQAGHFEVQDEGSQLIAPLLEPGRRDTVVDYCAGAGGKTLHLGALMRNHGSLYACDTSLKRLTRLRERVRRAGLDNVRIQALTGDDGSLARLANKVDRVLVDAPCSGSGTLRRSPDITWRLSEPRVADLARQALAILTQAARLVRPGGRLGYATCSLLAGENEDVVQAFLAGDPRFTVRPVAPILERLQIRLPPGEGEALRLWPHIHATDGFFAQVLERRDAA